MANTLNLGTDGNWAIKEGSALAYNDENNNFKPLFFDFSRASTATYVAKDGLIKTAASGVPRIDFLDSTEGSLKLEPQRTNLVTHSSELDNASWTKSGTTITANNTTSPDGTTNADKIIASSGLSIKIAYQVISSTNSVAHTVSAFYKADEYSYAFLRVGGQTPSPYVIYNLSNQSVVSTANATSTKIEDYGSGWYRVSMTYTANSATNAPNIVFLPTSGYTLDSANQPSYNGDGSSGGYIYGAQLEVGSYPTSYIPTSGATATRTKDVTDGSVSVPSNFSFVIEDERAEDVGDIYGRFGSMIGLLRVSSIAAFNAMLTLHVRNDKLQTRIKYNIGGLNFSKDSSNNVPINEKFRCGISYEVGVGIILSLNGVSTIHAIPTLTAIPLNELRLYAYDGSVPQGRYSFIQISDLLSESELNNLTTI